MPEFGGQSVDELLARGPSATQTPTKLRENLLGQVERLMIPQEPSELAGRQQRCRRVSGRLQHRAAPDASDRPAIEDVPLDGDATEIIPESRRLEGEGEINGSRPQLETEGAIQARRDADAAYEQAFNDLVKADALAASDQELMQKQQAVREAKAAREEADARLAEIQRTIEDGRRQQTEEKRRAILDDILADPETKNPAERFAAELGRQGFETPKSRNASVRRSAIRRPQGRRGGAEHRAVRAERARPYYTKTRAEASRPHGSAKARSTTRNHKGNARQWHSSPSSRRSRSARTGTSPGSTLARSRGRPSPSTMR